MKNRNITYHTYVKMWVCVRACVCAFSSKCFSKHGALLFVAILIERVIYIRVIIEHSGGVSMVSK